MAYSRYANMEVMPTSAANASVPDRMAFLRKVYGTLSVSLGVAAFGAYMGKGWFENGTLGMGAFWGLVIAEFVMLFVALGVARKPGLNTLALYGFTLLSGLTLGPVMIIYSLPAIQEALLLTVGIFLALTFYVMTSKKDFSAWGGFLFAGLIMMILASIGMFFFRTPMMDMVYSGVGVLLFSGFILYDTSNILRYYDVQDHTSAALALYLDILNLFLMLLRLLNNRD